MATRQLKKCSNKTRRGCFMRNTIFHKRDVRQICAFCIDNRSYFFLGFLMRLATPRSVSTKSACSRFSPALSWPKILFAYALSRSSGLANNVKLSLIARRASISRSLALWRKDFNVFRLRLFRPAACSTFATVTTDCISKRAAARIILASGSESMSAVFWVYVSASCRQFAMSLVMRFGDMELASYCPIASAATSRSWAVLPLSSARCMPCRS